MISYYNTFKETEVKTYEEGKRIFEYDLKRY